MSRPPPAERSARRLILAAGLAALLPLLWQWSAFRELYWFGDEWDLLAQIDRTGFGPWLWSVFAENFVPLFKLLWGGAVFVFGGHYLALLVLLWLTHAANTVLFGRLLHRSGFPLPATLACQLTFGLSVLHIETLGWTVQWSAVLATTFLLLGLLGLPTPGTATPDRRRVALLVLASAASALSLSRGVLTGAVLALAQLWPAPHWRLDLRRTALLRAALCLAPAVGAAALIAVFATGNHRALSGHLTDIATYAAWYFGLNPLHRLTDFDSIGPLTTALLLTAKLALLAGGLRLATPSQRHLLLLLLAFDLGNSALLGIGRYHTGLETTISSRYQYGSLLATLPFLGLVLAAAFARLPRAFHLRPAAAVLATAGAVAFFFHGWNHDAPGFAAARGTATRHLLHVNPDPPEMGAVPGISFLSTQDAKHLERRFGLE